jgi:hypothetical protein
MQQNAANLEQNVKTVKEVSASHDLKTQGVTEEISGSMKQQIGGTYSQSIGDKAAHTVAGDETNVCFGKKSETAAQGYKIQVILGDLELNSFLNTNIMGLLSISLSSLTLNLKNFMINAPVGFTTPGTPGPFCALPFCLFTGAPHTGNKFVGVPTP